MTTLSNTPVTNTETYFKYTNGTAFDLGNTAYIGHFHITDGIPYTGKFDTDDMDVLTPKDTMIGSFYEKARNFNNTYRNIEQIVQAFPNVHDIFTKKGLSESLTRIDDNTLAAFKGLVLHHPTIYSMESANNHFYGIKQPNQDPTYLDTNTPVLEFGDSTNGWEFLDTITTGDIIIGSDDGFRYICSNGLTLYVISGYFSNSNTGPLAVIQEINYHTFPPSEGDIVEHIFHIHHDVDRKQLIVLKNSKIDIYDTSNFYNCNVFLLVDTITLDESIITDYIWGTLNETFGSTLVKFDDKFKVDTTVNFPEYMRFGGNYRVSVDNSLNLLIWNLYSTDLLFTIPLTPYNVKEVYSLDIRDIDDNIIVFYKSNKDEFRLLFVDSDRNVTDFPIKSIQEFPSYTINPDGVIRIPNYTVKFSSIDSDVFYIGNLKELQSRFLSNPEYPSGRLEKADLFYYPDLIWGSTNIIFSDTEGVWGDVGRGGKFNHILFAETTKYNDMFLLLHNFGRIFALSQPIMDTYFSSIAFDTPKRYDHVVPTESSIGLHFNQIIKDLIYDVLALFTNAPNTFHLQESSVLLKQIKNIQLEYENLLLGGNETFNVSAISRIFNYIYEMQLELIPTSD